MSGGEMDREALEQESKKMEAKSFLETLYFLDNGNDVDSLIPKMREVLREKDEETMRDLLMKNYEQIKNLLGVFSFLKNYKKTDARVKHDLSNIAVVVEGMLTVCLEMAENGGELNFDDLNDILLRWGRYVVGVEDILLRIISEDIIPQEYNSGLNIGTVGDVINYFSDYELSNIKSFKRGPDSAYKEIDNKTIKFITPSEWSQLKLELGDRQIAGNNGLVGNFLLNALRNSIKDKIHANNVRVNAKIDGGWFVMRVEDDGKGIATKFLQPDKVKDLYIFHEGASGTGSTGIGLANFDTRLASVGGELYVASKQKIEDSKFTMTRFQYGGDEDKKNKIAFDESLEHGTVFEIRLPITKK